MNVQKKLWFSEGCTSGYKGKDPYFFSADDFTWTGELESNWEEIRDELLTVLSENKIELEPYAVKEMVSRKNKWKTFGMLFWSFKDKKKYCQMSKNLAACI